MCIQQQVSIVVGAVHKLDRRRVLLTTHRLAVAKYLSPEFQREVSLFSEIPEFPYNAV